MIRMTFFSFCMSEQLSRGRCIFLSNAGGQRVRERVDQESNSGCLIVKRYLYRRPCLAALTIICIDHSSTSYPARFVVSQNSPKVSQFNRKLYSQRSVLTPKMSPRLLARRLRQATRVGSKSHSFSIWPWWPTTRLS